MDRRDTSGYGGGYVRSTGVAASRPEEERTAPGTCLHVAGEGVVSRDGTSCDEADRRRRTVDGRAMPVHCVLTGVDPVYHAVYTKYQISELKQASRRHQFSSHASQKLARQFVYATLTLAVSAMV